VVFDAASRVERSDLRGGKHPTSNIQHPTSNIEFEDEDENEDEKEGKRSTSNVQLPTTSIRKTLVKAG
jgi:hypothetical protein